MSVCVGVSQSNTGRRERAALVTWHRDLPAELDTPLGLGVKLSDCSPLLVSIVIGCIPLLQLLFNEGVDGAGILCNLLCDRLIHAHS